MAIFHMDVKIISRSSGRSSVGASAYRSGEEITNEYDGVTHDYKNKKGIEYSEVMIPENAPVEFKDRKVLWNEVEKIEKSSKAQLSREVEVALPKKLPREEQIHLLKDYVKENFVDKGMCADINLHDKKDGNPHAHIMLTMRPLEKNGSWGGKSKKEYILDKDGNKQYDANKKIYKCNTVKTTDWDKVETLEKWRENWAIKVNERLLANNIHEQITHESFEKQGIERIPQIHVGPTASAMEKKGEISDRFEINRSIEKKNLEIKQKDFEIRELSSQINDIQKRIEYLEKVEQHNFNNETPKTPVQIFEPKIELKKENEKEIANKYFDLEVETSVEILENAKYKQIVNKAEKQISEIDKSKNSFKEIEEKRNELIDDKASMKFWNIKQKKELELEIEKYNNSMDQLKENFKNTFGIDIKDDAAINKFKEYQGGTIKLNSVFIKYTEANIKNKQADMKNLEPMLGRTQIKEKIEVLQTEKKGIAAIREEIKRERNTEQKKAVPGKKKTIDRER